MIKHLHHCFTISSWSSQQLSYLFINACLSQNSRIKHASRSIVERPASIIVRIVLFLLLLLLPPFSWSCSRRPRRPFFSNVRINPFMGVVSRIHCLSPILLPGGLLGVVVAFTPANGRYRNFRHSVWWRHGTHEKEKRWKWTDGRTNGSLDARQTILLLRFFPLLSFVRVRSTIMENIVVS